MGPPVSWLSRDHRVLWWDARGFGDTAPVVGPFSYAGDTLAILDALEVDRVTLVGCSMGGATAIRIALLHPERVDRLVLVGAGLFGFQASETAPIFKEMGAAYEAKDFEKVMDLDEKAWVIGLNRTGEGLDPKFLALAREMNRKSFDYSAIDSQPQDHKDASDAEKIGTLSCPVLVVVGDADLVEVRQTADVIISRVPGATKRTIPDATHMPNLEKPEAFDTILADWLAANPVQAER